MCFTFFSSCTTVDCMYIYASYVRKGERDCDAKMTELDGSLEKQTRRIITVISVDILIISHQIGEASTTFTFLPHGSLRTIPLKPSKCAGASKATSVVTLLSFIWQNFTALFLPISPLGQGGVHFWWLGVYITDSAPCTCAALRCRTKLLFRNVLRQGCKRATQHGNKLHGEKEVVLEEFKGVYCILQ